MGDWSAHLVKAEEQAELLQEHSDRMPLQYYHSPWLNMETYPVQPVGGGFSEDQTDTGSEMCVELGINYSATNLLPEAVSPKGGVLIYKTTATGSRRVVTQRDDDLLTPAEVKEQWPAVEAAMLKELLTWAKMKCFSRKARRLARNIIDTRWVLKWKLELPVGSTTTQKGPELFGPG